MVRTIFLCFALGNLLLAQPVAQSSSSTQKHPFTFEDMMALKRIGDPQVSPDGRWVIFSAVHVNLGENTRRPHLWIVPAAGGESRQLTTGEAGENRGRFSPDGKSILYTSAAVGGAQIWVAAFDSQSGILSGEARQLTSVSTEADGALWAPDGKNILFVSEVYPDCKDDACNRSRDEALQVAGEGQDFHAALLSSLVKLHAVQTQPSLRSSCRGRHAGRHHARRS